MLDTITMWIGYVIIIAFGLTLIGILMWITYLTYDIYLKRLLGWKHRQVREDIFYFIKHKEEIQDCIKKKKEAKPNSSQD
jgi:Ca2+/Na+ antiporter